MGGILGSIFGGGQQTSASQRPDPYSQDLNRTRVQQYNSLLGQGGDVGQYARSGPYGAYSPTSLSNMLFDQANNDYVSGTGNQQPFNLGYNTQYGGGDINTNFGQGDINRNFNTDYGTGDVNTRFNQNFGADRINSNFTTDMGAGNISQAFNRDYSGNLAGLQNPNNQLMSLEDFRKNTGDVTQNYINRLATPQIKAQLAAQGMEGSGALPEAIANATAQQGAQFAAMEPGLQQQNAGVRLNEAANARANAGMGLQAQQLGNEALGMSNAAQLQRAQALQMGNEALGMGNTSQLQRGQLMQLGNQAQQMGNEAAAQRAQMYAGENAARGMGNEALLQRGALQQYGNQAVGQRGQLYGMENDARTAYNAALQQQAMLPEQVRQARAQSSLLGAQRAAGLFNMSDQSRALQEQDYLRQQGLAQSAFMGMPYTPGSYQSGSQRQQPLFNWFGQG